MTDAPWLGGERGLIRVREAGLFRWCWGLIGQPGVREAELASQEADQMAARRANGMCEEDDRVDQAERYAVEERRKLPQRFRHCPWLPGAVSETFGHCSPPAGAVSESF